MWPFEMQATPQGRLRVKYSMAQNEQVSSSLVSGGTMGSRKQKRVKQGEEEEAVLCECVGRRKKENWTHTWCTYLHYGPQIITHSFTVTELDSGLLIVVKLSSMICEGSFKVQFTA